MDVLSLWVGWLSGLPVVRLEIGSMIDLSEDYTFGSGTPKHDDFFEIIVALLD